jgi:hypothetical protein
MNPTGTVDVDIRILRVESGRVGKKSSVESGPISIPIVAYLGPLWAWSFRVGPRPRGHMLFFYRQINKRNVLGRVEFFCAAIPLSRPWSQRD